MSDLDRAAIPSGPTGTDDAAVGGSDDRSALAGGEVDSVMEALVAEDRMEAIAEA
jgi:hypothetical protein